MAQIPAHERALIQMKIGGHKFSRDPDLAGRSFVIPTELKLQNPFRSEPGETIDALPIVRTMRMVAYQMGKRPGPARYLVQLERVDIVSPKWVREHPGYLDKSEIKRVADLNAERFYSEAKVVEAFRRAEGQMLANGFIVIEPRAPGAVPEGALTPRVEGGRLSSPLTLSA